jgi:hypothetical protein
LPWLAAGILRPKGLLREAANPLGFSASSCVFAELPGFSLEESPEECGTRGVMCLPGSPNLGLFNVVLPSGAHQGGGFGVWTHLPWLRLEGVWSITSPAPESRSPDWFLAAAPWPGAELVDLAAHFALIGEGASLDAALGASAGELAPPGKFWILRGSASAGHAEIELLAAGVDPSYRAPDGSRPVDLQLVSAHVQLGEGLCRLVAGCDLAVGRAEFSPHAAIPSSEALHALLVRKWKTGQRRVLTCSLEIDKRIRWDATARREEATRCVLVTQAAQGALDAAMELHCSSSNGFGAMLTARLRPSPRLRMSLEAGIDGGAGGTLAATLLCAARIGAGDRIFTLEAGVEGWQPDRQGLLNHLRFTLAWSTSSREQKNDLVRGAEPR